MKVSKMAEIMLTAVSSVQIREAPKTSIGTSARGERSVNVGTSLLTSAAALRLRASGRACK